MFADAPVMFNPLLASFWLFCCSVAEHRLKECPHHVRPGSKTSIVMLLRDEAQAAIEENGIPGYE